MGKISQALQWLSLKCLQGYRIFLSPWVGWRCRFYPSCSQYAIDAIGQHGFFKGIAYSIRRLGRCHPWAEGGIDVPPHAPLQQKAGK